MAEPSNIRVNPFNGTGGVTNYIELTEKHLIPAVSPYVIRLNEVPEKQDPSNIKMFYVDSATGTATENALTEVAATPSEGEFRMDYSTNAMEDKTWNTGLIEFSAADAGKIVQVTYTGTGTLAGVNSNHWPSWYTDRGDGSDGDFVPTENTTISGVKNYKSVFIKEGIKVTASDELIIKANDVIISGILTGAGVNGGGAGKHSGAAGGAGSTGAGAGGKGGAVTQSGHAGDAGTGGGYGGAGQRNYPSGGAGGKAGGAIGTQYGGSGAGGGGGSGGGMGWRRWWRRRKDDCDYCK